MVDDLARLNVDPRRRQRAGLAFALAIAITAGVLGFLNLPRPDDRERLGPVMRVVVERPPTPPPTPKPTAPPTPAPTPPPANRPVTPAPVPQRAAPRAIERRGGAISAPVANPQPSNSAAPAVAPPAAAAGTGVTAAASPGTGAGAGTGSGPGNGTGSGNGTGGTGTATANADTPCGFVEFIPVEAPHYDHGTASEKIRATVHFGDGHVENDLFPYPWVYPNGERTDPWSSLNLRINPNGAVHAQLPPPGADTARYPAAIRYILAHTTQDGITTLQDCPR